MDTTLRSSKHLSVVAALAELLQHYIGEPNPGDRLFWTSDGRTWQDTIVEDVPTNVVAWAAVYREAFVTDSAGRVIAFAYPLDPDVSDASTFAERTIAQDLRFA